MTPYRTTPVFTEATLPAAVRHEHRTKPGIWGLLRVLEGEVRLHFIDPPRVVTVKPAAPAPIRPDEPHFAEPVGTMRMRVEFYEDEPAVAVAVAVAVAR